MAKEKTPTGFTGSFETPGTLFPGVPGSGSLTINGAPDATWLEINYEKGDKPLAVQVGTEPIHMDPGSKIGFGVAKPEKGVSIHYEGVAKGTWSWMAEGKKGG